jgi:S-formylglutathione hydrolase FrmB
MNNFMRGWGAGLVAATLAVGWSGWALGLELPQAQSNGLSLQSLAPLDNNPRLWSAMVSSAGLSEPVQVGIHLPADYDSHPERRYPVLFLLHGHGDALDGALPWIRQGRAAELIEASLFEGIVVIPQCGKACWFTDWQKATPGGAKPQWETFYAKELLPWIDANFRTTATRESRAIAGLSMGGTGALSIAGRFPQLFSQVGSFSSATNIQDFTIQQVIIANSVTLGWGAAFTSAEKGKAWRARDVQDVFGPYSGDGWRSHNPYALAPVYAQEKMTLAMYAGGGSGPGLPDITEAGVGPYNDAFHKELKAKGVAHRYCHGSSGKHAYPYWQADLVDFLAVISGATPATCPNGWGAPKP